VRAVNFGDVDGELLYTEGYTDNKATNISPYATPRAADLSRRDDWGGAGSVVVRPQS
jgi:hypothetical protein